MTERLDFAVSIKSTHACGQVHEQIVHVKPDQDHSYDMHMNASPFIIPESHPLTFSVPSFAESLTEFVLKGYVGVVELNGVEMRDHKIVCSKCGADILFPDRNEDEA